MRVVLEALHTQSPHDMAVFERVRQQDPDLLQLQQQFVAQYGDAFGSGPGLMRPRFTPHDPLKAFGDVAFIQLLGPDVAHESHPIAQLDVVRQFGFPKELGLTAIIHDWGEAGPGIGDVKFGANKPKNLDERERKFRCVAASRVLGPSVAHAVMEVVEPHLDTSTEMGHLFKLSERVGYMKTILRATDLVRIHESHPVLDLFTESQLSVLRNIASNGLYHLTHLRDAASELPKVRTFLRQNKALIGLIEDRYTKAA